MPSFKHYVEIKDEKNESIGSAAKFAGGFGGNLIGQSVRGAGNAIKGVGQAVGGTLGAIGSLGASGAFGLLGNKDKVRERLKKSGEHISDNIGGGLKNIIKGIIQVGGAASFITPTLRGFQASQEKGVSGFNKNRNAAQKLLGLNSNKDEPYIVEEIPSNIIKAKIFIDKLYEAIINGREVSLRKKPEEFLKELIPVMHAVTSKYKNEELNKKFKYILKTYFPNFEIIELNVGTFISMITSNLSFSKDSTIVEYINYLHNKSQKNNVIIITNNDEIFFKELILIHNNYLSSKNTNDKEDIEFIKALKNKTIDVINKFFPNKKIKLNKKTAS